MNRLGFRPEAIPQVLFRLNNIPKVEVVDLLAHFANAEVTYGQDKPLPSRISLLHDTTARTSADVLIQHGRHFVA